MQARQGGDQTKTQSPPESQNLISAPPTSLLTPFRPHFRATPAEKINECEILLAGLHGVWREVSFHRLLERDFRRGQGEIAEQRVRWGEENPEVSLLGFLRRGTKRQGIV